MESMLETTLDFGYEIAGRAFIVYQPVLEPAGLPSLLVAVTVFHWHVQRAARNAPGSP
jgi:hypothetical protein